MLIQNKHDGYKAGRRLYHFGGDSRSSTETDNFNIDRRVATDAGSVGVSGDNNSIVMQSMDKDVAIKAIDSNANSYTSLLNSANAMFNTNSGQTSKLIDAATQMFNTSEGLIGQTQKSVADAYSTAQAEKSGTIDNKTIVVLAVAGAVAAFAFAGRKK